MIPEELDKALDKVKAEGRVSYQRSWVKRKIVHPRFRSSSTQRQGRQCLGHTTIWKRWLKFAPNIRLTNIPQIDIQYIAMHWFPWKGPRVLVHHIFRFGCMWTLAGEAQQFFQGTKNSIFLHIYHITKNVKSINTLFQEIQASYERIWQGRTTSAEKFQLVIRLIWIARLTL